MADATNPVPGETADNHRGNSRAVMKMKIRLGTTPAQKVLDRHFGVVSANLYHMCVMLPILTNTDIAARVEAVLEQYFEVAHTGIHGEIGRVQQILTQAGVEGDPEFTNPSELALEITTPFAARFANLTKDLDRLIALIENGFLTGSFTSVQRSTAIRHGQNRLSRLGGRIRNLYNSMKSLYAKGKKATLDDFKEAGLAIAQLKDDVSDVSPAEEFPDQVPETKPRTAARKPDATVAALPRKPEPPAVVSNAAAA